MTAAFSINSEGEYQKCLDHRIVMPRVIINVEKHVFRCGVKYFKCLEFYFFFFSERHVYASVKEVNSSFTVAGIKKMATNPKITQTDGCSLTFLSCEGSSERHIRNQMCTHLVCHQGREMQTRQVR